MYRRKMNLQKRSKLIILSGLALLLYNTPIGEQEMQAGETMLLVSPIASTKNGVINVTNEVYEQSYYNDNNKLCLNLVYRYPVLTGENAGIQSINKQIEKQRDEWIASQTDLIETAKQENQICNTSGNEVNYGVTYDENDIISILFEGYLYAGGAHGMPYRMPQTFQVSTGQLLSLTDITRLTKEEIRRQVVDQFKVLYEKSPDAFWDNAVQLVQDLPVEKYSYYVEQDGIHIYFDPYFVAAYAAGFVEIIL